MLKRLLTTTFTASLLVFGSNLVSAQSTGLLGDPNAGVGPGPDVHGTFETSLFDYDAQMFAPLTLDDLEGQRDEKTGFNFTYDRTYLSVSRPDATSVVNAAAVPKGNDYFWGNRFDLGYMESNGKGWTLNVMNSEGSFFSAGQDVLISNPFLTRTTLADVEISRLFRQELNNGGYLEPYFGIRYQGINDETIEDSTVTFLTTTDTNRFKQMVKNDSFGGHIGTRYSRTMGRWTFRTDTALAASYNSQRYTASDLTFSGANVTVFEATFDDNSFTPTLDLGFDASYSLTRDIALRAGVQCLHVWDGVVRADTRTTALNPFSAFGVGETVTEIRDQSLTAVGFTFGLEWNR